MNADPARRILETLAMKHHFRARRLARTVLAIGAACAALATGSASAHHSFAMFDLTKKLTLVGTITKFDWTNPHTFIWISAPDKDGTVKEWAAEGQSPNFLGRRGWSKNTVRPGDKVTLIISPLKNGDAGGMFSSLILPDGKTMNQMGISPTPSVAPAPGG